MKKALIQPEKCNNCSPCAIEANCTMNAIIRETSESKPWIDFYRCAGCMKCKTFCPYEAIVEIIQPCNGKSRMGW